MVQAMFVISLCLILIVNVSANHEQFQTRPTGKEHIEENGSNKLPENIDKEIIEGKSVSLSAQVHEPKNQLQISKEPECAHLSPKDHFRLESPIDIDEDEQTEKKANLPIVFLNSFEVESVIIRIEDKTHRLEYIYPKSEQHTETETTNRGGTKPEYDLISMRVHFPARHTCNKRHFDAEIEFIYREKSGQKLDMYAVSVLVRIDMEPDTFDSEAIHLRNFMNGIEAIHNGQPNKLDLKGILSKDSVIPGDWYKGTTMTPPCSQEITRYIAKEVVWITETQAQVWTKDFAAGSISNPPTATKEHVYWDM